MNDRHVRTERACEWCGTLFMARVERVNKGQGRFCSMVCANEMQRQENKKKYGYENGKKYWDGNRWIVHWKDNDGNDKSTTYQNWWWNLNVGDVPEGYVVKFIDGNPENIDPSNFELVTRSSVSVVSGKKGLGKPKPTIAGENSRWWKGGVSRNGGYGFGFSKSLKKRIKIRDGYMCQCCYFEFPSRFLQVHHIDKDITNNDLDNLITVCTSCHRAIHGTERKTNSRIQHFQALLPDL